LNDPAWREIGILESRSRQGAQRQAANASGRFRGKKSPLKHSAKSNAFIPWSAAPATLDLNDSSKAQQRDTLSRQQQTAAKNLDRSNPFLKYNHSFPSLRTEWNLRTEFLPAAATRQPNLKWGRI
jgi:hypothetical protein